MTLKIKPQKLPKKIKYWVIQIYDSACCEVYTYEVFRNKKNAKRYLKAYRKNSNAEVAKVVLKFKD